MSPEREAEIKKMSKAELVALLADFGTKAKRGNFDWSYDEKVVADDALVALEPKPFIAHDFCGWDQGYGRFTHLPSGDTLLCRPGMDQTKWDQAQLDWLKKYPGLPVHSCPERYTTEGTRLMGTTEEIVQRLTERLSNAAQRTAL